MAVSPSSQHTQAPGLGAVEQHTCHAHHTDGHMDQHHFNQAARAFGHAWRACLQEAPISDSRPHIGHSILQSSWNVQVCKDPFTQQEVVYLAMTRLLHTAPPAAAVRQPHAPEYAHAVQHQHPVQHGDQQRDASTGTCSSTNPGQQQAEPGHSFEADAACLTEQEAQQHVGPALHMYDLHIVWHPAYQVPTLLLKGYCTDGLPLPWTSVESDFPHWEGLRRDMGQASWAFITPLDQGHPILHRATAGHHWLMLHPCHTHDIMRLLISSTTAAAGLPTNFSAETTSETSEDIRQTECDQRGEECDGVRDKHLETGDGGKLSRAGDVAGMPLRGTMLTEHSNQTTVDCRYLAAWLVAIVGPVLQLHVSPLVMTRLMGQLHTVSAAARHVESEAE